MSRSFELSEADWATVGTVGEPGRRTFYLQARQEDRMVTLKLEKQQVAALAELLGELLADLPEVEPVAGFSEDLVEPVLAEWAVGSMRIGYDSTTDRVVILAEEFGVADLDPDEGDAESEVPRSPTEESDPSLAVGRIGISRSDAARIAHQGWELVQAGRPLCDLCGHPMDPEGHSCPKTNGHHP